MNALQRIGQSLAKSVGFGKSKDLKQVQNLTKEEPTTIAKNSKKRLSSIVVPTRQWLSLNGQDDLKMAIETAKSPENPNREMLHEIYEEILRDFHLRSQMRTAINEVIAEPWAMVDKKTGKINEEVTKTMQAKWFYNVSRYFLEAEFFGHSLIEFGQLVKNEDNKEWEFKDVKLFPRKHVRPETGEILINPSDTKGIPYREAPFNTWLIEAGEPDDLGLLEIAARYSIYKKFTMSDWSRSGEKWGDPLLVIRSDSDDDTENNKKAEFAANFGSNGFVILDKDDEVEMLERQRDAGFKIFGDFWDKLDSENSKGMNGQTGTQDQKSFVGAAQVHERILQGYSEARLLNMKYFHNDVTIPFLKTVNGGDSMYKDVNKCEWIPLRLMKKLQDPNELPDPNTPPDPNADPKNPKGGNAPKKRFP